MRKVFKNPSRQLLPRWLPDTQADLVRTNLLRAGLPEQTVWPYGAPLETHDDRLHSLGNL